jgi:hypothetical protein
MTSMTGCWLSINTANHKRNGYRVYNFRRTRSRRFVRQQTGLPSKRPVPPLSSPSAPDAADDPFVVSDQAAPDSPAPSNQGSARLGYPISWSVTCPSQTSPHSGAYDQALVTVESIPGRYLNIDRAPVTPSPRPIARPASSFISGTAITWKDNLIPHMCDIGPGSSSENICRCYPSNDRAFKENCVGTSRLLLQLMPPGFLVST